MSKSAVSESTSHELSDDDLARIVTQALAEAREKGPEDVDQTGHAVRAVLAARPDMTASDALRAVNTWRNQGAERRYEDV